MVKVLQYCIDIVKPTTYFLNQLYKCIEKITGLLNTIFISVILIETIFQRETSSNEASSYFVY